MEAAREGHEEMVALLLAQGSSICSCISETPLKKTKTTNNFDMITVCYHCFPILVAEYNKTGLALSSRC